MSSRYTMYGRIGASCKPLTVRDGSFAKLIRVLRYLVLEYVQGGELFDHIVSNHGLPESEAIRIFRQMIAGLSYCHRFSICHRDLKPENILLDSNRNVKIVDFGMAALQPAKQYLRTACGSPHYAAPEVIRSEGYSGDKADVWSCGVILFAMIVGTLPFDGVDFDQVIQAVLTGEYEIPAGVSEQAADLIYRMLQPNPKQRIPMKQIWQHPIVQKYANLDCTDAQGRAYIGPATPLTSNDCGPRIWQRTDIDGEILRNLQNLWHGASEEEIAQKLLSDAYVYLSIQSCVRLGLSNLGRITRRYSIPSS